MSTMKNVIIETDSLMTIKDAAKLAGVTRMTLYRWIDAGKITTISFGNIKYVVRKDVEAIKNIRA